ncbi:MerR family transcriptional regulator [Aceticella autotrophica]|uniref:MerR family transcriptional regulator n=1 Tax=Aceticella autotrophica TaxID=2755338 RepID=A0A975AXK2_9THEO|nr:TIGR03826 family flagellar region protein [Aceticella autotrophica]QSZ28327.1 MerR family transcriptional regulator [Aceticella autotrophica]
MDLRNCKRCGKLYTYNGIDICPECYRQDEEDFLKIRNYLETHPSDTMLEVSRNTGVEIKKIMEFLKEERLILSPRYTNIILKCERCGKPISSGRYCDECSKYIEEILAEGHSLNNINTDTKEERQKLYIRDSKGLNKFKK